MARWVYRIADGLISHRCQYPDATTSSSTLAVIDLPDKQAVDALLDRIDPVTKQVRRATAQELADRVAEIEQQGVNNDSRRVDVLTTIAWVVRRDMGPAQFDALTNAQKKTAILAEADKWKQMRAAVERWVN